MRKDTIILAKNLLETASDRFEKETITSDEVIQHALHQFRTNDKMIDVCIKAVLINALYQTAILDIKRLAEHIVTKNIDSKLNTGDVSVVEDIRSGHGIKSSKGRHKEINFYSFATKYVHFHQPNSFPIYDNLVMRLLCEANKKMGFCEKFTQSKLKDYSFYKFVIDSLAQYLSIADWGYKKIDQGLWMYARGLYTKKN